MNAPEPEASDVTLVLSKQILELLREANVTRATALAALNFARKAYEKPLDSEEP